jgi:hypothetical protein
MYAGANMGHPSSVAKKGMGMYEENTGKDI